jgi:hypothetical protein
MIQQANVSIVNVLLSLLLLFWNYCQILLPKRESRIVQSGSKIPQFGRRMTRRSDERKRNISLMPWNSYGQRQSTGEVEDGQPETLLDNANNGAPRIRKPRKSLDVDKISAPTLVKRVRLHASSRNIQVQQGVPGSAKPQTGVRIRKSYIRSNSEKTLGAAVNEDPKPIESGRQNAIQPQLSAILPKPKNGTNQRSNEERPIRVQFSKEDVQAGNPAGVVRKQQSQEIHITYPKSRKRRQLSVDPSPIALNEESQSVISKDLPKESPAAPIEPSISSCNAKVAEKPTIKVDRFGWRVSNRNSSPEELRTMSEIEESERKSEEKWEKMTANFETWSSLNRKKIEKRVDNGIPNKFRGKAWMCLLDPVSDSEIESRPSLSSFISISRHRSHNTVDVDLHRTFPTAVAFANTETLESLRRVCYAYANYDPLLGYVQGMSFIAGMFLLYMEEKRAFWCFQKLMNGPIFHFADVYRDSFQRLKQVFLVWDVIFARRYPKVFDHLSKVGVEPFHYAAGWFLTGFANSNFPPIIRLRIFDRILLYGFRAIISFALAIISVKKKKLVKANNGESLLLLQNSNDVEDFGGSGRLLKKYTKLWISKDDYREAFKKAKVDFFI